ncbi:hypothetical protein P9A14_05450 [Gordonia hongkongensis]|uniref:Secreted protein n=1 Tax=Gordonia hongkongensis TaxID=1701090 RepID=A0AAX3TAG4_9ACTN|nr:hypothetical protein [Gordonia hongkongensis]QIK49137.1 hypothetical protein G8C36_19305 [Gordonia terrae]WFP25954.1 hypothetical protein P9A14_05450 [Gordonia hongkongensis]
MTLSKRSLRIVLAGASCVAGATFSTVAVPSASAEPTGCVAGAAVVAAASYCSGGTGEHRVQAACLDSTMVATLTNANGPWRAPGQLSVVTIGAQTNVGKCILPAIAITGVR